MPRYYSTYSTKVYAGRGITLADRRTTLRLEPEFWSALEEIAKRLGRTIGEIATEVDMSRRGENLSSAVRVYILRFYRG